jgi:diaminopropionate ammonia-lyase
MIPQLLPVRYLLNREAKRELPYGPAQREILNQKAHEVAFREISSWEEYRPTPLRDLPGLARALGIETLWYKDEGARLGLKSFKALGGSYGVYKVLLESLERAGISPVPSKTLIEGAHRDVIGGLTVSCASVGNHGQSVAMGATMFGCRAIIFLPAGSSSFRVEAIQALGAEVMMVKGTYDDAVAQAARTAEAEGWLVVSDTAYPGYEEVPRHIMQGYTIMVREALEQLPPGELPTHVFLQAGVGGLAAAVTAHLWETLGPHRPVVTVVEPAEADCLFESALAGSEKPSLGTLDTTMAGLACRDPSLLAWGILGRGADAFLTIPDYGADETVTLLEEGVAGDVRIRSQPSGVAGLTGLIATIFEPTLSKPLGLGENSRVIIFGSEGPA